MGAVPPAGSRGRAHGQGLEDEAPQKLKAFRCMSSKFLYFLGDIVKIQHLDVMFTVTARA